MITGNEPAVPSLAYYNSKGELVTNYVDGGTAGQLYGLTIRQHFAALAMQSLVATTNTRVETLWSKILRLFGNNQWKVNHNVNQKAVARASAEIADALIAELNK